MQAHSSRQYQHYQLPSPLSIKRKVATVASVLCPNTDWSRMPWEHALDTSAGHSSALSPFTSAAERSCLPFSCALILVSTFTLPPFPVVSTNIGAAPTELKWWIHPSLNYTTAHVSSFNYTMPLMWLTAAAPVLMLTRGSSRPGKKSQEPDRPGQFFL